MRERALTRYHGNSGRATIILEIKEFRSLLSQYEALFEQCPGSAICEKHPDLRQAINYRIPLIYRWLRNAGIKTHIARSEFGKQYTYDLIAYYLQVSGYDNPKILSSLSHYRGSAYRKLIDMLDHAIGAYHARQRAAYWELFKPWYWLAFLLRAPLTVLEIAGLADEQAVSRITQAYAWVIRTALLLIIVFVATKLGISIPWEELINLLSAKS